MRSNGIEFFGEFMGTMVLILMGNGVVANVLLKRSQGGRRGMGRDHGGLGVRGDDAESSPRSRAAVPTRTSIRR